MLLGLGIFAILLSSLQSLDNDRMKKYQRGQSTVEYILLLVVIFALSMTIYKSLGFKNLVGEDSVFFSKMRAYVEHTYRHGGSISRADSSYTDTHDTYWVGGDNTHFFSPLTTYPASP